jgi:tryptophan synthase alpha chain
MNDNQGGSMDGLTHIANAFASARAEGRAALMPYFTLGFPDSQASLSVLKSIAASGADLIELGVPFSDPLADGPTIQHSTQVALEHGASMAVCLDLTAKIRAQGITQPLLLMGYYNPILAYGIERFVSEAAAAGADGFIIPDLPPEEASEMEAACQHNRLALVYLLAPTSTPERIAEVAERSTGFVYLVSLTGVTGARQSLPADLEAFISRVRSFTEKPLAVGFGISTPEQARNVGRLADGVIIGSALVSTVEHADAPSTAAGQFVSGMRRALAAV